MRLVFVAVVAASWALTGTAAAESSSVSVPIEPTPVPIQSTPPAPPAIAPTQTPNQTTPQALPATAPTQPPNQPTPQVLPATEPAPPDAQTPSRVSPTEGSAALHNAALQPTAGSGDCDQARAIQALKWLEAACYGNLRDMRRVGPYYRATVDDPAGHEIVTVDPDSGWIGSNSAVGDRETHALNLLAEYGYLQIKTIRPAGTKFVARVMKDGKPLTLVVDPDHERVRRGD